jgi:predicted cupin superfamily sugar epimerase
MVKRNLKGRSWSMAPEDIIRALNLAPLPGEGGYFRETYRADEAIGAPALPARHSRAKAHATAIYYLIAPDASRRCAGCRRTRSGISTRATAIYS